MRTLRILVKVGERTLLGTQLSPLKEEEKKCQSSEVVRFLFTRSERDELSFFSPPPTTPTLLLQN